MLPSLRRRHARWQLHRWLGPDRAPLEVVLATMSRVRDPLDEHLRTQLVRDLGHLRGRLMGGLCRLSADAGAQAILVLGGVEELLRMMDAGSPDGTRSRCEAAVRLSSALV